ncbi:hypothetical protein AALB16_00885 [Lachnospiraceae bacterium 62-35]
MEIAGEAAVAVEMYRLGAAAVEMYPPVLVFAEMYHLGAAAVETYPLGPVFAEMYHLETAAVEMYHLETAAVEMYPLGTAAVEMCLPELVAAVFAMKVTEGHIETALTTDSMKVIMTAFPMVVLPVVESAHMQVQAADSR